MAIMNYKTFKQLDSQLLELAEIPDNLLNEAVRQSIVNDRLFKLYAMVGPAAHRFYDRMTTITIAADQDHLHDGYSTETLASWTPATLTLARTSGNFVAGEIVVISVYDRAVAVNGTNFWSTWVARVNTTGATTTVTVISSSIGGGNTAPSPTVHASCVVIGSLSTITANISTIYFSRILGVFDNAGSNGNPRNFYEVSDPTVFEGLYRNSFYDARVAWNFSRGDTIRFYRGASAAALGTVQMHYVGKPSPYTDATENNTIDIPPEENQLLFDECMVGYLQQANRDVSSQLQAAHDYFNKRYEASQRDAAKAMELKGKRG